MATGDLPGAVLLARIQAGDELALGAIYDLHADLVHGVARRVTRDEQLARGEIATAIGDVAVPRRPW